MASLGRTLALAAVLLVPDCEVACAADHAGKQGAANAMLPAGLPLVRDADRQREQGGWALPLLAATLAGAGGAWTLWRRGRRQAARSQGPGARARLVRLSSQALTAQATLHAVQWNGEELLLACTGQQVSVIARRAVPPCKEDDA